MAKKSKLEKNKQLTPFAITATIFLTIYSLTLILPLCWAVFSSLKLQGDFINTVFSWPQKGFQWGNWIKALTDMSTGVPWGRGTREVYLYEMFGYSIFYSVVTGLISEFSRSACAYVAARYKHLGWTKFMHTLVLILMVVSFPSNLAVTIGFYKFTHLYNNLVLVSIMSFGFTGTSFLYFYAAYSGVSKEYSEAAEVDGANQFTIMIQIIMPMVKNIFIALFILNFIATWNDYSTSLVYLPSYPMVAYGLYLYQSDTNATIPLKLASCALVIIPTLTVFIVFRNRIVSNLSIGGLKG